MLLQELFAAKLAVKARLLLLLDEQVGCLTVQVPILALQRVLRPIELVKLAPVTLTATLLLLIALFVEVVEHVGKLVVDFELVGDPIYVNSFPLHLFKQLLVADCIGRVEPER